VMLSLDLLIDVSKARPCVVLSTLTRTGPPRRPSPPVPQVQTVKLELDNLKREMASNSVVSALEKDESDNKKKEK